jgi:hypothetical protein
VPPPPGSIDAGPSTPAPDETSTYVPGCWVYRQARYWWRPGFWVAYRPDWCWVPAHYVWTPVGCLFVEGYWDRPLYDRGLLFAPVRIQRGLLAARFTYVPRYVVRPDFLIGAMFIGPARSHYYFGDYFEERYEKRGFVSWMDYRTTRHSYDPLFAYYRHTYRGGTWERSLHDLYEARRRGDVPRPPRTLVLQQQVVQNITVNKTENVAVTKNINITNVQNVSVLAPAAQTKQIEVTNLASLSGREQPKPAKVVKLEAVSKERRDEVHKVAVQGREVAKQRHDVQAKLLSDGGAPVKQSDPPKAVKLEVPKKAPKPPAAPDKPKPAAKAPPPPPPAVPKHEDKPPPKDEHPVRQAMPPKKGGKPPMPPKKEDKPPETAKKDDKPPPPPKKDEGKPPPPPPKKEDKPPEPPKKENPPPKKDDKPPKKDGKPDKKDDEPRGGAA